MADIALITIDLDETVWPCAPVIEQAEHELLVWLQQQAARLVRSHDLDSLRDHRRLVMQNRPEIAHDITAVRMTSLRLLLKEFDYAPELAGEAMDVFLAARNRVSPFPDVYPVLQSLAQLYCIASITNGNADVKRTSLGSCFDFSLSAAQVGAPKPAPDLFQHAIQQAGVEPVQALHIGDDPLLDVEAARRVGMCTVWVNRKGAIWPEELPPPNVSVRDFYELASWLTQL